MRIFATSDVHVDYEANARWIAAFSRVEYVDDVLILAGDVSDSARLLGWTLGILAKCFAHVLFVPGNHDLWVIRDGRHKTSIDKFTEVCALVTRCGASMRSFHVTGLSIFPLLGWYDYSFGAPADELRDIWMDYVACKWPPNFNLRDAADYFESHNETPIIAPNQTIMSFSHFLPRIDVMPNGIPKDKMVLYPVLGALSLDTQLRALKSTKHIYGHSHVNRHIDIDGVTYINNAFGYPRETRIASKELQCVHTV
jgi:predicted phosphodiesterase